MATPSIETGLANVTFSSWVELDAPQRAAALEPGAEFVGRLEHRTLWRPDFTLDECGAHFGRQDHPRAGMCASPGDGLATHIHHGGLVAVVNMGKHR